MTEILDVKVKVRRVSTEDGAGYGVDAVLEGVQLDNLIRAINTGLVAKGSKIRAEVREK